MADLAAGEGFAILHDTVKHGVGRIFMFKSQLKRLESTLAGVAPMVQEIEELSHALNFPEDEIKSLIEQIEEGKKLVGKCAKMKLWNYCFKAYCYSSKLSKINQAIEKFCQVDLSVQNTRNGLKILSLVSQNREIGLETLTGVNRNTRIGLDTLAEVNHNTTIGLENLAEVNNNTTIGLEDLAELNQNTTIGLETLEDVNHCKRIGLETLPEVNEVKRTLDLVLKQVESQNSDMKKKYGTFLFAVPKPGDYIVGFDLHLKELKRELLKEEVSVLIVTGPGGCGKTTLVKMLGWDEDIIGKYMGNIFFVDVSETPNLKVIVQKLFCYIGDEDPEFQSDEDAINKLEQLLNQIGQPILLILDDVWPESESLIDKFKFNIPDYKIVVTSRKAFSRYKFTFKLNPLDHKDAMRLFCHSASMQDGSSNILKEDTEKIVGYCGGLPIALEVIGGSLRGQPVEVWQSKVMGWSEGHSIFDSDNEVLACLEKCLDFSADKIILKEYFMDLGSFPKDERISATALVDIWTELHEPSKKDIHAIANLHELNNRNLASLVMKRKDAEEVSYYYNEESVTQNDLLRELAIQLSSQKPIIERTRLIVDIRENNLPDWWMKPQHINARLLSISTDELFSSSWCNIQAPEVEALILNLRTRNYTLPDFVKIMDKLKVIVVTNYGFFPAELSNFQLLSSLHHLKRIRLEKVSISSLCNTLVQFRNLKKISLFMCNIGQTFGNSTIQVSDSFPTLMEINIDYCTDLVELPARLCEFLHLKVLNITNCYKLSKLPEAIGKLVNLEVLRLRSCIELSELPESIRSLHKLCILDISNCIRMIKLPQHISELDKLKELHMKECLRLPKQLPSSITELKELRLVVCDEERAKLWEPFKEFFSNLKVMVAKKDIKWKRPVQKIKEGEFVPQKGTKQQKMAKDPRDKRATSVDSREEQVGAKVPLQHHTWSPQVEVDGVAIPWNASVREFQRGHSAHIAEALEQPLLLPKDMDAIRKMGLPDLFMSLKRDLAMTTQKVSMAEEWVKKAQNDVKNEVHLRFETERALGAANEENKELLSKLIAKERERKSAEVGLKNAQTQVEDQRKLLYQTEIALATSSQPVLELRANLQKAREAAQLAKEATKAEK